MSNFWRAGGLAALTMVLAACGGGGGGGDGGSDSGGGSTPFATLPAGAVPRIEPYDAPVLQALGPAKQAAAFSPRVSPSAVTLGAPALVGAASVVSVPRPGAPRQIGQPRDIAAAADAAATRQVLAWQALAGGARVAALSVRSEGAAGLRLALRAEQLPAAAVLRVYAPGTGRAVTVSGQQVLDSLARDAEAASGTGLYWLPAVDGEVAALEIELPAGTDPAGVALAVPQLSHLWTTVAQLATAEPLLKDGKAGSCNVDATCSAEYIDDGRAVAKVDFVRNGSAFVCSGTLLADTSASRTPWFLTARHCITDQAVASTVTTHWFYRAAACGSTATDPAATQRTGGATLRYVSPTTDTAFLQLNQSPPGGVRFAGSLLGAVQVGLGLAGLHHPSGDLLKLSLGTLNSYARCTETSCVHSNTTGEGEFITVRWHSGTTEFGSSGSGAFATMGGKHYVVGHLFAGSASCSTPNLLDYYGRFDRAYSDGQLSQWLGNGLR